MLTWNGWQSHKAGSGQSLPAVFVWVFSWSAHCQRHLRTRNRQSVSCDLHVMSHYPASLIPTSVNPWTRGQPTTLAHMQIAHLVANWGVSFMLTAVGFSLWALQQLPLREACWLGLNQLRREAEAREGRDQLQKWIRYASAKMCLENHQQRGSKAWCMLLNSSLIIKTW